MTPQGKKRNLLMGVLVYFKVCLYCIYLWSIFLYMKQSELRKKIQDIIKPFSIKRDLLIKTFRKKLEEKTINDLRKKINNDDTNNQ